MYRGRNKLFVEAYNHYGIVLLLYLVLDDDRWIAEADLHLAFRVWKVLIIRYLLFHIQLSFSTGKQTFDSEF